MALSTDRSSRVELVAPAGNLEKLKIAVAFGADAVYFGGERMNLRSKTSNFSFEEMEEACRFCRDNSVRTVFLLNSFLHESDIQDARKYIEHIRTVPPDAIMISDPGMLMLLKDANVESEIHLSTQMSTLNHLSVKFWNDAGIKRIVLARETSLDEIREIRKHTDSEIEIFAHGSLCISYSGRCLLSRFLSGRDANLGFCSHPCRWRYSLVEEKRAGSHLEIIEHADGTEILSSKDLCLIKRIPEYIEAGVSAFKIEGRMKSIYYTANTTRIYRHAIDTYREGGNYETLLPLWLKELDLVSHRPYAEDLFNEFDETGFTDVPYIKKALFLGYKLPGRGGQGKIPVKIYNPVSRNDEMEAIFPIDRGTFIDRSFRVEEIIDPDGNTVDRARPGGVYSLKCDSPVADNAVFRKQITQA